VVESFFADPDPTDAGIEEIVALVHAHRGTDYALKQARVYGERAADALGSLPGSGATDALRDAVTYVVDRRH
jgi:geranylgeranyl pyrophosphate synthase